MHARIAFGTATPGQFGGVKVLVAHGQRLFAQALGLALRQFSDLEVLPEHPTTGDGVLELVQHEAPEVALLAFWIPGRPALEVLEELRRSSPGTGVILLSNFHSPDHVQQALAAGAVGFLPTGIGVDQVAESVRHAHAGAPLAFAVELAALVDQIQSRAKDSDRRMLRLSRLTARELEVLQLLAEGRPGKEAARQMNVALGTFKNHVRSVISKTGARTHIDAVNMARYENIVSS